MQILFVARHGETELNAQQRYQGSSDYPLNTTGLAQAHVLAATLPDAVERIVASPLLRARQTAEVVAHARGLPVTLREEFRERDYGCFERLNREDVIARYPTLWASRISQQWDAAPPGGETMRAAVARVATGLAQMQRAYAGERVLLVAHGFVAKAVRWLLLELAETEFYLEPMLDNARFQHYRFDADGRVLSTAIEPPSS